NYDLVTPVDNGGAFTSTDIPGNTITGGGEAYSKLSSTVTLPSGFMGVTLAAPDTLQAACTVGPERVPATMQNVVYSPLGYKGRIQTSSAQLVVLRVGSVDVKTP
ncbi:MAG TPA: hypothetical protein VK546_04670, partial [Gaiellales bacterium]|nr:hypothetical protein [Gaiellales bacterium]